jgi:hypothetical protein
VSPKVTFLLLLLAGCGGPSAQQRYDTALDILEREQKELARSDRAQNEAMEEAFDTVCREFCGHSVHGAVAHSLNQLTGITKQNGSTEIPTSDPEEAIKRIDEMVDEMKKTNKQINNVAATFTQEAEATAAVQKAINTPGTKEAERFEGIFEEMPARKAYLTQLQRVERAKKAVADAEAAM